jgi:hypothetical protein
MVNVTVDHYSEIASWYIARSLPVPLKDFIPSVGLIVPGLAAGFLFQTDTRLAIIGEFISNPDTSSEDRSRALDEITEGLCERAKSLGFLVITCSTQSSAIEKRAIAQGFKNTGSFLSYSKRV